jgi:PAS domain S-box-containing protein
VNNRVHSSIQQVSTSAEVGKDNIAFRLLVDAVQDYAIFILDPEGRVLTWNSGARAIKGYTREEIVGKHFSIFYPQEAIDSHWPERELALAEKEGRFRDEGLRVKKDGSTFWASVTITALREPDGRLYGFAKVTQDLTTRREAEERLQTLNRELVSNNSTKRVASSSSAPWNSRNSPALCSKFKTKSAAESPANFTTTSPNTSPRSRWTSMPAVATSISAMPWARSFKKFAKPLTCCTRRCSTKPASAPPFTGTLTA